MKQLIPFFFLIFVSSCVIPGKKDPLEFEYHLPETAVFDLTKSFFVTLDLTIKNTENKKKSFRHRFHTPAVFLYNNKTKQYILSTSPKSVVALPGFFKERKKWDSLFLVLLLNTGFGNYYPVKPYESIPVKFLIHAQTSNGTMPLFLKHSKDLELHIYNDFETSPFAYHFDQQNRGSFKLKAAYRPPDAKITSIHVIPCAHDASCR